MTMGRITEKVTSQQDASGRMHERLYQVMPYVGQVYNWEQFLKLGDIHIHAMQHEVVYTTITCVVVYVDMQKIYKFL